MLTAFSVDLQRLGVMDNSLADPAPAKTGIVLIGPVAGAVPEEAFGMPKHSDPVLIIKVHPLHVLHPFLDDMIGLVSPFAGVHNLDLTPESLSDANESTQHWGQLTPSTDGPFASASISDSDNFAVRAYLCEDDIVNAYYIYIHPYIPLLPASDMPPREDCHSPTRLPNEATEPSRADLPYWPKSSLGLALSALLVMIPLSKDPSSISDMGIFVRRSYAQLFAQAALACVERDTDDLGPGLNFATPGAGMTQDKSSLHSQVPAQLEQTLALVVLSIYEYCQRGNVSRMRARINQAITTAMDISLHNLGSSQTAHSEAQRRTWWITMFVAYLSSNLHLAPPVITLDDPRITTPFPQFDVELEPWGFLMQAQRNLFASNQMINSIERMDDTAQPDRSDQIKSLDFQIVSLMTESDRSLRVTFGEQGEASIAENMWRLGRIIIFTARTRLHRFRAFMNIPLFLDKYCHLPSINNNGLSEPSPTWVADRESSFPFTEQESSNICLKASLVVATAFRNLPYPNLKGESCDGGRSMRRSPHTIPFFACCAMQSCYTLLMLLHKVRACLATDRLATCYHLLNKPEPATETSDVERLTEELRHGVESLGGSMKADIIFEGVGSMGREIEHAYLAAFPDGTEF
ncbi:hypothetical protein N7448_003451 [Penicillium atrosanguineum]|uniref:Transcription factor domain-containing protein n=1 Tax=Penicillium atrosanguineum TaxID=1132637 RepID=A0A9W9PVY8_9EURO|nr:hypothetical protein N7526_009256 [Penicillium atrosanguineum]KAJ5140043.1 hypothetical protein N7448_003451 [Penicillium atrosanguineum]KAJ5315476.1 hypothetical protein N7476_005783 [Penicillium atrosanguineum]